MTQKNTTDEIAIRNLKEYISSRKKISQEAILWLFRKDHSKRTEDEITALIDNNLAMVFRLAVNHHKKHVSVSKGRHEIPFLDLYNSGVIGLYEAIEKFDSFRGCKFSTFAYPQISAHIRQEIKRHISQLKQYSYVKITESSLDAPQSPTIDENTSDLYETLYYRDLLDVIKRKLSEKRFVIFEMYFVGKQSMSQIGDEIGLSTSTVQYHVSEIRSILKNCLSVNR